MEGTTWTGLHRDRDRGEDGGRARPHVTLELFLSHLRTRWDMELLNSSFIIGVKVTERCVLVVSPHSHIRWFTRWDTRCLSAERLDKSPPRPPHWVIWQSFMAAYLYCVIYCRWMTGHPPYTGSTCLISTSRQICQIWQLRVTWPSGGRLETTANSPKSLSLVEAATRE